MILRINRKVLVTHVMWLGVVWTTSCAFAHNIDFYQRHAEGWFWYQDPPVIGEETEEKVKKDEHTKTKSGEAPLNLAQKAHQQMNHFKKRLEDLKVIALVNPIPANVEAYMRIQKEMMERSEQFSKTWQRVVLTNADLNPEVVSPTAQFAKPIVYEGQENQKKQMIVDLSKTHGLIYFFKGNCPYCTGFAPIVQLFAKKYNWQVMAIALDGSSSDVFPEARPDNGIGATLNLKSVPALMAFNAETNDVIPISYAMTSLDQLENNVMALVGGQ